MNVPALLLAGFPFRDLPMLRLEGVPLVIGMLSFNYGGHTLFPSLHAAMQAPKHFPRVLDAVFLVVTALYAVTAVLGYLTFGDAVE
jgi:vesicular inhibitory amino acid transporter